MPSRCVREKKSRGDSFENSRVFFFFAVCGNTVVLLFGVFVCVFVCDFFKLRILSAFAFFKQMSMCFCNFGE